MSDKRRTAVVGAALMATLLLGAGAVHAQAPAVAGTYRVEFDSQMRMGGDGVPEVAGRSPAMLVLEVRGDSVFGTWQRLEGANQQVRKLAGRMRGDTIVVLSEPSLRVMNRNGEEIRQTVADEFRLRLSGDAIAGTMTPTEGMAGMPPLIRKLDGKREKSL